MNDKEILDVNGIYVDMENTPGWQYLKKEIEADMEALLDKICAGTGDQSVDNANRGQLAYAREIFKKIESVHENKKLIKEEKNG